MLIMRKGCKVPFPERLDEGYEVSGGRITANVSAEKIAEIMTHFIRMHDELLFFILELPSRLEDETIVGEGIVDALHKDVYYIDGLIRESALAVLRRAGELMINDGLCSFGFGCHESEDEIMFCKYNVAVVFSREISKFDGFFEEHGIGKTDSLVTAWETFSEENPGECSSVETDGRTVYSIPEEFAEYGMYKAEQRED